MIIGAFVSYIGFIGNIEALAGLRDVRGNHGGVGRQLLDGICMT